MKLSAIGEIKVLGQRVVLPSAGGLDCSSAPDAGGAVEVEESAAGEAGGVLDSEVSVEENRLNPGEQRESAVEVVPEMGGGMPGGGLPPGTLPPGLGR